MRWRRHLMPDLSPVVAAEAREWIVYCPIIFGNLALRWYTFSSLTTSIDRINSVIDVLSIIVYTTLSVYLVAWWSLRHKLDAHLVVLFTRHIVVLRARYALYHSIGCVLKLKGTLHLIATHGMLRYSGPTARFACISSQDIGIQKLALRGLLVQCLSRSLIYGGVGAKTWDDVALG